MDRPPASENTGWGLAYRLAQREARAGFGGFRVFLICLAMGVGAIASVGLLGSAFHQGLVAEGRVILGGDVELTLTQRRASVAERAFLERHGTLSEVATLRAMAHLPDMSDSALVQIKAVDGAYPLFGRLEFSNGPAGFGFRVDRTVAVDPILLDRLRLKPGGRLKIGRAIFTATAKIAKEPDRIATGLSFGPRVLMSLESLAATGLVRPGSLVRWRYRLRFSHKAAPVDPVAAFRAAAASAHPTAGWRIRDRTNSAPRIKRFVDRLATLLTFVALTALVVGGVGIGTAAKTYLDGRIATIATLKCLGASGGLVFKIYLLHLARIVAVGSLAGLALSLAVILGAGPFLQSLVAIPAVFSFYGPPLLVAVVYGVLVTGLFAVWSLGVARDVPAAALYRAHVSAPGVWPARRYIFATAGLLLALVALTFFIVRDPKFAGIYTGGVAASFVVFWLAARLIVGVARRVDFPMGRTLRLALIHLRGARMTTTSTVIALGLGLTLLVSLTLVEGNFVRYLVKELPKTAPSFFFVDIQPGQLQAFERMIKAAGGIKKFERVPMLRGRITKINGIASEKIKASSHVRWVLSGDRGITYSRVMPAGIELTAGSWWPEDYSGPPLVSFANNVAQGLGLKLGDRVTVNVIGRELTAKIANLRNVEWGTLGINFVMVFSPDPISAAPHSFLSTVSMAEQGEGDLMRTVAREFANVTTIRVREVLQSINDVLNKLLIAARVAAGLTLLTGVIVLIGALASSQRARRFDAVMLKTLGLTRPELMRVYIAEHAMTATVTGLLAAICGTVIGFGLMKFVFHVPFEPLWLEVAGTILGAVIVTILLGLAGTWRILAIKPARVLHEE